MTDQLRSKTVKAVGYLSLGSALGKVFSLGTTLILARLLTPEDYGLMAMSMIVIDFIGFFNEVGIGSAIVQKKNLTDAEVNGCFAIALISSTVLFLATIIASPFIADFFNTPHLQLIISILAIAFILGAFSTVPLAFLRKGMHFKIIAGVTLLSVITNSLVCLALASMGKGVWSLVWGFIASSVVQTACYFILSHWRPKKPYGIREAMGLVVYGLHVTSSRIFWFAYSNADKVIIGKLLGIRPLGIYDMAFSLATLPSGQITSLVTNVASPLFSKLQHDLPRLSSVILKLSRGIAYATYPALIGMLATSRELIAVVLGTKWVDILIPFAALCLMGLIKSVDPLLSQVLIATGHAKKLSAYTALCGIVMSISVVVGAYFDGLRGVSLVWVLIYPMLSAKLLYDTCKITGMRMFDYYKSLLPVLMGSLAMGGIVLSVREIALYFSLALPIVLTLEIVIGFLSYLLWVIYFDRHGINEIRQVMIDAGVPENRFNRWPFVREKST